MLSNHYTLLQSSIPVFLCYIAVSFPPYLPIIWGRAEEKPNVFMLFQVQIQPRLGWP